MQPAATRGGDLRDMVRQLIEEAKRIPEPPPLPVNYDDLLAGLQRWIDDCEAANRDVDAAVQVRGWRAGGLAWQAGGADGGRVAGWGARAGQGPAMGDWATADAT